MADRTFIYNELAMGEQNLIPPEARAATNDVEIQLRNPHFAVVRFIFQDVPDVANRVTARFLDINTGEVFIPETPVEAPNVNQIYMLGHRKVVPSGLVGKITGTTEGPGQGVMVDYDLDITLFDQLLARGVTEHSLLCPPHFIVEMRHEGNASITYQASVTAGDLTGE